MDQLLQTLRLQLMLMKSNMLYQLEGEYTSHVEKLLQQKSIIMQWIHQAFDMKLKHLETIMQQQQQKKELHELLQVLSQKIQNPPKLLKDIPPNDKYKTDHPKVEDIKTNQLQDDSNSNSNSYIFDSDESPEYISNARAPKKKMNISMMEIKTKGKHNQFECSYCGKQFGRRHHLTSHLKVHTNEKPFECKYCEKSFKWKHNLKTHLKIHERQKPFECGYCCKRFTHKKRAVRHQKKHHKL